MTRLRPSGLMIRAAIVFSLVLSFVPIVKADGSSLLLERQQALGVDSADLWQPTVTRLQWRGSQADTGLSLGAGYEYRILDLQAGQPAHNGHLHQLGMTAYWQRADWQVELNAGLHGSSNMFANQRFHADALVLEGQAMWQWQAPALHEELAVGLAGDYRFGGFALYPRFDFESEWLGLDWQLHLPVAARLASADGRWRLALQRQGEKWAALDRSLSRQSAIYLSHWQLTSEIRLGHTGPLEWRLVKAQSFSNRLKQQDLELGAVRLAPGPTRWLGLSLTF